MSFFSGHSRGITSSDDSEKPSHADAAGVVSSLEAMTHRLTNMYEAKKSGSLSLTTPNEGSDPSAKMMEIKKQMQNFSEDNGLLNAINTLKTCSERIEETIQHRNSYSLK